MKHYHTLISADQLASLMEAEDANNPAVIFDCRFSLLDTGSGWSNYKAGHIPGAIYAHLDDDLAGDITPHSGRHPLPNAVAFLEKLNSWGVTKRSQVVVYDDAGGAIAARLWWMMGWVGHGQTALLDGGYAAWLESGRPVLTQTENTDGSSVRESGEGDEKFTINVNEKLVIEVDELTALLNSGEIDLFDARAEPRFAGKHEPIDAVAGHIPGAVNLPFEQNLDGRGYFLGQKELESRFESLFENRTGNRQIAHMCGSGVTACHNILAMKIAGIEPSRLYVGSWSEWVRDPAREVAVEP